MSPEIRVHELANELGMPARDLLRVLEHQQVFVKSASSRIDADVADKARESVRTQRARRPRPSTTPRPNPFAPSPPARSLRTLPRQAPQPRRHPAPARQSQPSDAVLDAAQMFGVDPASLREKKPPRQRDAGRPSVGPAPTQGSLAVELGRRFRLPPETARAAAEPWAMLLLATDELTLRRFWDAGFDHTQHRQVEQCLAEGITPDDLDQRVDGRRIGEHILSGGPIRYLAICLRQAQRK